LKNKTLADYETRVHAKISSLVPASENFFELCSKAEGIFPAVAFGLLKSLRVEHDSAKVEHLLNTAYSQQIDKERWFVDLENLIVDFDWRFQKESAEHLFRTLLEFKSVVCIGTPTVFSLLSAARRTDILIDQNPYYKRLFGSKNSRVFCSAIEDFDPADTEQQFEAALLDPPWYLEDYECWLQAAIPLLAIGGSLFIPVFPNLLRETVESDVFALMEKLVEIGQVSILPFKVRYETPTFEEQVLHKHGLPPLHGWRSAHLLRVRVNRSKRSTSLRHVAKEKWDRFEFGRASVAVRSNHLASNSSKGRFFFLDNVSNRDKSRRKITAVSSRNVATDFQDTALLLSTLRSISERIELASTEDPLILASRDLGASYG
jgi:hypothetical protein